MTEPANARAMIEAGVPVALSTDRNPGSSPTESLPFIMNLACLTMKMTPEEVLAASTINAAHAIGRAKDIGSIEAGKNADLVLFDAPNYQTLQYNYAVNRVDTVMKAGKIVVEGGVLLEKTTINGARLQRKIEELGQFGKNEKGGLDRTTFTSAELAAREWLQTQCVSLGLDVKCDPAANIWAFRNGRQPLPAISFGSHMDTVPNGGMYDGALGVLIALEVMERLNEERIETRHPFALVSFTAEEPNPFGLSTFGSRAVAGKLTKQDLEGVTDDNELLLTEALRQAGEIPIALRTRTR